MSESKPKIKVELFDPGPSPEENSSTSSKKERSLSPDTRTPPQPRTPSPGPFRAFYQRLEATLPRRSPTSHHPVVQTRSLEWSDRLDPKNVVIDDDDASLAPAQTHLDALLIRKTQYFLVPAKKAMNHLDECRKFFGFVTIVKRTECSKKDCRKCPACAVCVHTIRCTCKLKFRKSKWCPHLHLMQEATSELKTKTGYALFVQKNWNFTQTRHFQSFLEGHEKMKRIGDQWAEITKPNDGTCRVVQHNVIACECPRDKKCTFVGCEACICRFSCSCEDYSISMNVCYHVHNVAMQRNRQLFKDLGDLTEMFRSTRVNERTSISDLNQRYVIYIIVFRTCVVEKLYKGN